MCSASNRLGRTTRNETGARVVRWVVGCLCLGALLSPALSRAQLRDEPAPASALRVCSDPNNLPFSNRQRAGFENELAALIAADLGLEVQYTWWPQRRGFIRNTLAAKRCDVVMGVPAGSEMLATSRPYYRSSYAFVTRSHDQMPLSSFDDPRLRGVRIGVHVVGENDVPPVRALARRQLSEHMRGFPIYGDYSQADPPRELIDAVAEEQIDVAIAWGPLAGYVARTEPVLLDVTLVQDAQDGPMAFDIALGVRKGDSARLQQLDAVLQRRAAEIDALLKRYGVPVLPVLASPRGG
jgi:mxaJ protein